MKSFLLFLSLTLPYCMAAQRTAYFDELMNEVSSTENYRFFAEIAPLPEGGFYVKRYRADSTLVTEGAYSEFNKVFRTPEGMHKTYRTTGELWYTKEYLQGKPSGELRSYYPSGALKRTQRFADGLSFGGNCYAEDGTSIRYTPFETPASYPGGVEALTQLIANNIRYPTIARQNGIEGTVQVAFIVGTDGVARDFTVIRDMGAGCGEEAVRILKLMDPWTPGTQDDAFIQTRFILPVVFKLEGTEPEPKQQESSTRRKRN